MGLRRVGVLEMFVKEYKGLIVQNEYGLECYSYIIIISNNIVL